MEHSKSWFELVTIYWIHVSPGLVSGGKGVGGGGGVLKLQVIFWRIVAGSFKCRIML